MNLPGYDKLNPRTTLAWHIANVYRDKDFVNAATQLFNDNREPPIIDILALANKYYITASELSYYGRSINSPLLRLPPSRAVRITRYGSEMDVTFSANASRAEIDEVLDEYFRNRHSLNRLLGRSIPKRKKRKPTESPELIYAIFKAHVHAKLEISEVYALYITDELPGYKLKAVLFSTVSKLKEYYEHFQPVRPEL